MLVNPGLVVDPLPKISLCSAVRPDSRLAGKFVRPEFPWRNKLCNAVKPVKKVAGLLVMSCSGSASDLSVSDWHRRLTRPEAVRKEKH